MVGCSMCLQRFLNYRALDDECSRHINFQSFRPFVNSLIYSICSGHIYSSVYSFDVVFHRDSIVLQFGLHVYDTLLLHGKNYGLRSAGYYALRTLRMEKFFALWGTDISSLDTPLECGREYRVKLSVSVPEPFIYIAFLRSAPTLEKLNIYLYIRINPHSLLSGK